MAKKKTQPRRVPRAAEPRMYGDGKPSQAAQQGSQVGQSASAAARTAAAPAASRGGASAAARPMVPFQQEYAYVLKDLRRLGILAVSIFVVLIALGIASSFIR